ncbi:MAG: hypothetical protein QM673_16095 [Gordonia sp. (in: high G+C Gram-positive bacteria)]
MLASVVFVPSAPLLVPQLAGPAAFDTVDVRVATLAAGGDLAARAPRWFAVGATDPPHRGVGNRSPAQAALVRTGSFARFGIDVPVGLDAPERADRDIAPPVADSVAPDCVAPDSVAPSVMPLSMLIAAWLRAQTGAVRVDPVLIAPDTPTAECLTAGRELRRRIEEAAEPVGVLVVGDGAIALTATAPGGGVRESAVAVQQHIVEAIAAADTRSVAELDVDQCRAEGVAGRAAWQVAAGLVADTPVRADVRYADAPFGVGYIVASWTPEVTR